MATKTTRLDTLWHVPDELWALIAPILGPEKVSHAVGRPNRPFRQIFDGILYVLRTGCQWQALPREAYGPASTVHARFRKWVQAGAFNEAWQRLLAYYDEAVGIDWKWQALDAAITKAPLGGEATGPSPVDRAKCGTKRSVLTDRRGAPLSIVVTAANTHDKCVALDTLDHIVVERPSKVVYRLHHLCLDKGYDYDDVIAGVLERDYILHLKKRGQPSTAATGPKFPARRWVVERTHSWLNRCRRLLVRWEKTLNSFEAMIQLASIIIIFRLTVAAS
jgi:putative transposase